MKNLCIYFVKGVSAPFCICRHSVDGLNRVRNFSLVVFVLKAVKEGKKEHG